MSRGPSRLPGTPTAEDRATFARSVRALTALSDATVDRVQSLLRVRQLARGEMFLKAGERATQIAVVAQGWLREYYLLANGSERTKAFAFEGDGTGSYADLMSADVSTAYIVAEVETRLLCLGYDDYLQLRAERDDWDRLHTRAVEVLFLRKAQREYELLALDAEGRYRSLLARAPRIEDVVSAKLLASYLGITPVHLSRLRRMRAKWPRPDA